MGNCTVDRLVRAAAVGTLLLGAPAAQADDDTQKGLIAGFGLAAASGKTSLGEGAGAIEAGSFNQEALQQAGAIIAMVANEAAGEETKSVLLLTRTETLDWDQPELLKMNLDYLSAAISRACKVPDKPQIVPWSSTDIKAKSDSGTAESTEAEAAEKPGFFGKLKASDLGGAALVERTIGGVAIAAEDRALANAVLMNAVQPPLQYSSYPNSWNAWKNPIRATAYTPSQAADTREERLRREAQYARDVALKPKERRPVAIPYRVLGEPQDLDQNSPVYISYRTLRQEVLKAQATCPEKQVDAAKGWVEAGNALLTGALSTEKGPSALTTATQIEAAKAGKVLILRVALDQVGGTTLSRSGLLYSIGWPNAVTVGAGLMASFRLSAPGNGAIVRQGVIRCMVRQANVRSVTKLLEHREYRKTVSQPEPLGDTVCDFRVTRT